MKTLVMEPMPHLFWEEIQKKGWNSYFTESVTSNDKIEIIIIRTKTDFNKDKFTEFPNLKMLIRAGSGFDNIDIIEGYSSSIYEFSKYVIKHKIIFPNLKMVKATSETIQDEYIISVKKAFGLNLISEYGSAESGIISFSCEKGNMHVNELNVIVEESSKEIIVTNLNSHSFPIIKYVQGDYIDYNTKKICSCVSQIKSDK
jgi:phenylacetate-CoA ligase